MKRSWPTLLLFLFISLVACNDASDAEIDRLPVRVIWEEDWGLVNARGRILDDNGIAGKVSPVVNGFFSVRDSAGLVTLYRASAEPAVLSELTGLLDAGFFNNGLVPVVLPSGEFAVGDGFGRVRFKIKEISGKKVTACAGMYRCGVLAVCNDAGLWGAVDKEGRTAIEAGYVSELVFCNGLAIGVERLSGVSDKFGYSIINNRGDVISTLPTDFYMENPVINHGYAVWSNGHAWGLADSQGKLTELPMDVCGVEAVNGTHLIYIGRSGLRGVMTVDGRMVLPDRFNSLEFASSGVLLASNARHYFLMDLKGNEILRFDDADEVISLSSSIDGAFKSKFGFAVRSGSLWDLCDISGCRVGNYEFAVLDFSYIYGVPQLSLAQAGAVSDETFSGLPRFFEPDSVCQVPDSLIYADSTVVMSH
ncbi:MAG: hypothetical protein NC338_06265 [Firmicutes bacterium]|nr:hypothetical protein [Bacillota bacterium]MCM1401984.1 hypothetical protein [Bacteroides sp.]MCM1477704.1 hypothetical protein [Bacteroides sp.]